MVRAMVRFGGVLSVGGRVKPLGTAIVKPIAYT